MKNRRVNRVLAAIAGAVLVAGLAPAVPTFADDASDSATATPRAKRVLYLVVDQLSPSLIDTFNMQNVKELMNGGTNFPNSYLGHMGSETVVSHNVMTSGQLPRDMGWSDEALRDTTNTLGDGKDAIHVTGELTAQDYDTLISTGGYKKVSDYLHDTFPGSSFITVGEKGYAVQTAGGPTTDIQVAFSGRNYDCDGDGVKNWRGPDGKNVPEYLAQPTCDRFYVDSDKNLDYGTKTTDPAWMYPLDGNRYVPGFDNDHQGGDVWTTDAATAMMEKENWSGMLVTLAGVDKAAHMWGINDTVTGEPGSAEEMTHLPYAARTADEQVGKIVEKLRELGQLDETLIVLTADHGGQPSTNHHGVNAAGRGDYNWYYGDSAESDYLDPSPALQPLLATGNVAFSYQDSAIRTWLKDPSSRAKRSAAGTVAQLPDVLASYYKSGSRYQLAQVNWAAMNWDEYVWWTQHGQELVDTAASPTGPDVIGLLKDESSYGVAGDHGGHQEAAQRIPIVFYQPGLSGRDSWQSIRSVDILPTVLQHLGVKGDRSLDGKGYRLR